MTTTASSTPCWIGAAALVAGLLGAGGRACPRVDLSGSAAGDPDL
jgi:hypothetical protein